MSQKVAATPALSGGLVGQHVDDAPHDLPAMTPVLAPSPTRSFNTRGRTLRGFAARGMLINTGFNIGLNVLFLIRGILLAAFLTRTDYGIWSVLGVTLGILAQLKVVGIGDKYMQQDEPDQELAFQRAFTMEAIVTATVMVPLYALLPVVAVVYGHWSVVLPGAIVLLTLPAGALQVPLWAYFRKMEFTRARSLQAIDPVVGFTVTVGLAIAGAGYWALVGGTIAGAWAGAILAVKMSPYPLRWRYERAVMRIYFDYSWPLFVSNLCVIVLANSGGIATNAKLGLAGVGVVGLASTVTQFSTRLDDIISGTLFPAICAFKDRIDLLRESFAKVNRLALMWAMPFGVGIALFVGDLVHHVLGDRWAPAIGLLQITGVVAAVAHIGFNWDDYYRAEGDTKPIMATQIGTTIAFVAAGVPLTLAFGLRGLGIGIAFQSLVGLFFRAYYLRKLFHGFGFLRHAVRAIVPTVPAVGAVLLARLAEHGARTLPLALAEFASYLLITAGATWLMEDRLLAEAIGYMLERPRRWGSQPDPASAGSRRSAATFLLRAADER